MQLRRSLLLLSVGALVSSCVVGEDPYQDNGTDDDGSLAPEVAGNPALLNIGFNDGHVEEFGYYPDFFNASSIHPGPRLCHAYFQWDVANQAPHSGSVTDVSSRAYVDNWFALAQGTCDDVLVSFKSQTGGSAPSTSSYASAFEKFAATNWAAETGYTGTLSFTPWNEPNNGGDAGDGVGAPIDARLAARYYLAAERSCRAHGCKVAAGDFASNGNMWNDFEWNCANDNVQPSQLCNTKSWENPSGAPASYMDRYKNEIVNRATDFGLPAGFRPEYFAYHGWHDSNEYLDNSQHCSSYGDCSLRRLLRALGGSWKGVVIWNTEDGIGQDGANRIAPGDALQACGAAFELRLQTISNRVHRLYITRLHGGNGQLVLADHTPRPAMLVLANRQTSAGSCN